MSEYIEVHKARQMYAIIRESMALIDKGVPNPLIKNELKIGLNKVLQFLSLKNLKVIDGTGHNKPQEASKFA